VSDIAQVKTLDGRPTTFLRFDGSDKYVVDIDGEGHTITRDEWRRLPLDKPSVVMKGLPTYLDRLG
jgi:hypothetical protein